MRLPKTVFELISKKNMKVIGFFLFLTFLVVKSKGKYVEGHIKTFEVENFYIQSEKILIYVNFHVGLGICVKILFSFRKWTL